jgi:hypothetical protein
MNKNVAKKIEKKKGGKSNRSPGTCVLLYVYRYFILELSS